MYEYDDDTDDAWPVMVDDGRVAGYVDARPLLNRELVREHTKITCARCGSEYVGSIFALVKTGSLPPHRCRKPRRWRDKLRIL